MVKTKREEIEKFVKKELVPVNNTRVECADGRYQPEQSQGAIRAFGGDFGFVLAFAAALQGEGTFIDPDEIVERYYRAVKQFRREDTRLYYHTDKDHHAEGKIGCGHAAQASSAENEGKYGIPSEEARALYETFAKHPSSNTTILEGKHEEKGVLIVHGEGRAVTHSINSRNENGMYFVVDAARIDTFIDLVTPIFSRGLIDAVGPEDVKASYIKQQNATAQALGADKLPMYRVGINGNGHFMMEQLPRRRSR